MEFSPHARDSMRKRGASAEEVKEVIDSSKWQETKKGRFEAKQDFPHNAEWNGKFYKTKQVNPVFVVEDGAIVVITVFAFYF